MDSFYTAGVVCLILILLFGFDPHLAAAKAQKHFEYRIALADGFLQGAAECFANRQYNVSTFMLHQVAEQCCIALLHVYLDYRLHIHNLNRALRLCGCFSDRPLKLFASGGLNDHRLLDLLIKSYSHSRYKDDFVVAQEDAEKLYGRVCSFVALTREMCIDKIEFLKTEVF